MQALRPAARAAPRQLRSIHTPRTIPRRIQTQPFRSQRRNASTTPGTASPEAKGTGGGALAGGVAGGLTAVAIGYAWYSFSGAKTVVNSAQSTKAYIDSAFRKTTEAAPKPSEAVQWLKQTVEGYTKFIPGANHYVEQAFADLEKVEKNNRGEVEKIAKDTYDELKGVTKAGASMEAAVQAWSVLQKALKRIGNLAGDAVEDVLDNHPEVKEKVGGQYKQLKQMAQQYGPEAQKQFDDVTKQVQDIVKGGFSAENIQKAQKLVEEKTQELRKYGDKAWEEGIKQVQPVLDKQPELKEYVEKNKDKLLQGDLGSLWSKVQEAAKSGNTDDVKKFVEQQVQKGQQSLGGSSSGGSGGGFESLLAMVPGGKDIGEKLKQLQELKDKHGQDAEKLLKSAFEDIKGVLEKKVEEGKQIKDKAEKDVKS